MTEPKEIAVPVDRIVAGGVGLGRAPDGRMALVAGALPGELVQARVEADRRDHVRATAIAVNEASPERVAPPCPHVADGCGGCDWQHIEPAAQARFKRDIVVDALNRIARHRDPHVAETIALSPTGYRTSMRTLVTGDGRAALRKIHSHDPVTLDACLVAHPLIDELIHDGRFGSAREVTLRCGARTGERLVLAHPTADGVLVPPDVRVIGTSELQRRRDGFIHERVGDTTLRISAQSFFQAHADTPHTLVELVRGIVGTADRVADLYAGVGLFGATLAANTMTAVESNAAASRDARHNLRDRNATVLRGDVTKLVLPSCDAVVADPSREGLGRKGVRAIRHTGAETIALVSCDPAAFARDTKLLSEAGYRLVRATPVDQFPGTHHVEVVSHFTRRTVAS